MKKSLTLILAMFLILLALVSCNKNEVPQTTPEHDETEEVSVEKPAEQNSKPSEYESVLSPSELVENKPDETKEPAEPDGPVPSVAELVDGLEYKLVSPDFYSKDAGEHSSKYTMIFYGTSDIEKSLVDETEFENWLKQFYNGERTLWECNMLTIVQELEIPEEELLKAHEKIDLFTQEQLKTLYSGDMKKINEAFVNPCALLVDGEIFTPDWLATHTAGDYIENGITFEALKEYLTKLEPYGPVKYAFSAIAVNMKKMNESFSVNSVKAFQDFQYSPYLYVVPDEIYNVISKDEYEKWVSQFIIEGNSNARDLSEFNLVNLIEELGISAEDLEKAYEVEYELKDAQTLKINAETMLEDGIKDIDLENIKHVIIGSAVKSNQGGFFKYFTALESIEVESGNLYYESVDGVLYGTGKGKLVAYPIGRNDGTYSIHESCAHIGESAFEGSVLEEIILPDEMYDIGYCAFKDCKNLKKMHIPAKVYFITDMSFAGCDSIESFTVDSPYFTVVEGKLCNSDGIAIAE